MWKKLSSKTVFEHPRLTLGLDEILLPNGNKINYLIYEDLGDVVMIVCERDGKVLLQKEYTWPSDAMLFHLPGGVINKGEKPEIAANRELMEEAGYRAKNLQHLGKFLVHNRRSKAYTYVFLATDLVEESIDADQEEYIEPYWFTEVEVDGLIKKGEIVNHYLLSSWNFYKVRDK